MTDPKNTDSESALRKEKVASSGSAPNTSAKVAEPVKSPPVASQASVARKTPGMKDVIPFRWKLVGKSHGVVLTLFKAIEREEVEAQLQRVRMEGYYTNLQVLDIEAKVEPAPSGTFAKRGPHAGKRPQTKTSTRAPKAGRPKSTAKRSAASEPGVRPGRTKAVKAAKPKLAPKSTGKKTAGTKSTRKRRARKR